MANTKINIRIDSELKKEFQNLCSDLGITMTTAFNTFVKNAVKEHRIPFEIGGEVPNELTEKTIEDARNGIGVSRSFSSVKELMNDLNAKD